jgi:hypothetical protein
MSDTKEQVVGYADEALICGMRERTGTWALIQLPFGGEVTVDCAKGSTVGSIGELGGGIQG